LKDYRKSYRESRAYKAYLRTHPDHEFDLQEQISRIQEFKFFKEKDNAALETLKKSKIENTLKKIQFYQNKSGNSKYSIPTELEKLVQIKD
jgi:hypothetical protein